MNGSATLPELDIPNLNLNVPALIEASAGTGKTYTLTYLVLRFLLGSGGKNAYAGGPLPIEKLLIVTFTRAAASDLRSRIATKIKEAREVLARYAAGQPLDIDSADPLNSIAAELLQNGGRDMLQSSIRRLQIAERDIDKAAISTIHAFCNRALNSMYSLESGQDLDIELRENTFFVAEEAFKQLQRELCYGSDGDLLVPLMKEAVKVIGAFLDKVSRVRKADGSGFDVTLPQDGNWSTVQQVFSQTDEMQYRECLFDLARNPPAQQSDAKDSNELKNLKLTLLAAMVLLRSERLEQRDKVISNDEVLWRLNAAVCRSSELCKALRSVYPVAMIDEFQDTDPVQYSIFSTIYLNQQAVADGASCFLIGDPKQSIYKFRRADVNSYYKAKQAIAKLSPNAVSQYTINTNYRSNSRLVEANNDLFSGKFCSQDNPENRVFGLKDAFTRVKTREEQRARSGDPATEKSEDYFYFSDSKGAPKAGEGPAFYVYSLNNQEFKSVGDGDIWQINTAAKVISKCLHLGRIVSQGQERKVKPEDIAVLVRTKEQGEKIREALRKQRIPAAVQNSHKTVTDTDCRQHILLLMTAMSGYQKIGNVRTLLASRLAGLAGDEYVAVVQPEHIAKEMKLLATCADLWRTYGFLRAFESWLLAHGGVSKFLGYEDGERSLRDYCQLAEIVQQKHDEIKDLNAQIMWFKSLDTDDSDDTGSDIIQERLESEKPCVKIQTMHSSKGLEFPLVFMPFIFRVDQIRSSNAEIVFLPQSGDKALRPVLDVFSAHKDEFLESEDEEAERLAYVALTRACLANFVFTVYEGNPRAKKNPSKLQSNFGDSRFSQFMGMRSEGDRKAQYSDMLEKLPQQHNFCFSKIEEGQAEDALVASAQFPEKPDEEPVVCADMPAGAVKRNYVMTSFTGLMRASHTGDETGGEDEDDSETSNQLSDPQGYENAKSPAGTPSGGTKQTEKRQPWWETQGLYNIFECSGGTDFGTRIHAVMECCEFSAAGGAAVPQALQDKIMDSFRDSAVFSLWRKYARSSGYRERVWQTLTAWMGEILHAPFMPYGQSRSMCLADLQDDDCVKEMRYLCRAGSSFSLRDLDAICMDNAAREGIAPESLQTLGSRTLQGFIQGSLDLVFRYPFADGNVIYLLDYKTNKVGDNLAAYLPDRLKSAIFSSHSRYDVQYLLYSLALHRYLCQRLPGYDYDKNYGGVVYLYLRALSRDADPQAAIPGVFTAKPAREVIDRLDRLFAW